jgi:BMFP domain-containing protein YqiC
VEDRYKELTTEVLKQTRGKRKTLQGRKTNLERSLWQADQAGAKHGHTFVKIYIFDP